ncbi:hypothetical protein AB3332_23140 [Ralstonia solanacearum]|uniref:hypothetical protein n=1 Tax=Ralstonia solanacearum TaxID=305 RepID=UPI0034DDADFB
MTSFTYDALWFESVLYPLLRANGCEQIVLVVDARHAPSAIDQAETVYGGAGYRVMRVRPNHPQGLFHPKIAYLQCKGQDVLVVGSGNLTNRGQGPALEVIDAVSAKVHPNVFEEFAVFLERMPDCVKLLSEADCSVLSQFANRARAQGRSFTPGTTSRPTAQLVASLDATPLHQLAAATNHLPGKKRTLTVLSPFFDPPRKAVQTLAQHVNAAITRYAVVMGADGWYGAPFPAPTKVSPLTFVTPSLNSEHIRPLHAKWFEISDDAGRSVTMTGSVNATQQSLAGQWNVEVSLLRWLDSATTAGWHTVDAKDVAYDCAMETEACHTEGVHSWSADLGLDGHLRLAVYPAIESQPLTVALRTSEPFFGPVEVQSPEEGHVNIELTLDALDKLNASAVWVDITAEMWTETLPINVAELLEQTPAELEDRRINQRLTHAKFFTPTDVSRALSVLDNYLNELFTTTGSAGARKPGKELGSRSSNSVTDVYDRLRRHAFQLLQWSPAELRSRFEKEAEESDPTENDDEETEASSAGTRRKKAARKPPPPKSTPEDALQQRNLVMATIDRLLQAGKLPPEIATQVAPARILDGLRKGCPAQTWAVDTAVSQVRSADGATPAAHISLPPASYLVGQFRQIATWHLADDGKAALLQLACWSAAFVAVCLRRRGIRPPYNLLRLCLSKMTAEPLTLDTAIAYVRSQCELPAPGDLPPIDEAALVQELPAILGDTNEKALFENLLHWAKKDRNIAVPDSLTPYTSVIEALRNHRDSKKLRFGLLCPDTLNSRRCPGTCGGLVGDEACRTLWNSSAATCGCSRHLPLFLSADESLREWLRTQQKAIVTPESAAIKQGER